MVRFKARRRVIPALAAGSVVLARPALCTLPSIGGATHQKP